MNKGDIKYRQFIQILNEELVPAMGCTEPIAIAYAAAMARSVLGDIPEQVLVEASGNIIKNVKSVIVPNTNGLCGIVSAAAAGIVAGDSTKILQVISEVSDTQKKNIAAYIENTPIKVEIAKGTKVFDLIVMVTKGEHYAKVRIADYHTNVILVEKDGETLTSKNSEIQDSTKTDRSGLNVKDIYDFALAVDVDDVRKVIQRQIEYNYAIAKEGIKNQYGANIGKVLLKEYGNDVKTRAKALAAAGSDARMSGCDMPVVINSGSGNQGITVSVPVIEYANEMHCSEEKLYRALVLSNLLAIHQKTNIGCLSAYCGAVSAGSAAGAAICYLMGGDCETIDHCLVNSLAIVSGIVCDGAKPSCAAKIAFAVEAGILGGNMYKNGQQFMSGDGIVKKGVENTIVNVGRLGRDGMKETDREILKIMIE